MTKLNLFQEAYTQITYGLNNNFFQYQEMLKNADNDTLFKFAQDGYIQALEILLKKQIDISNLKIQDKLPIQFCAEQGYINIVWSLSQSKLATLEDLDLKAWICILWEVTYNNNVAKQLWSQRPDELKDKLSDPCDILSMAQHPKTKLYKQELWSSALGNNIFAFKQLIIQENGAILFDKLKKYGYPLNFSTSESEYIRLLSFLHKQGNHEVAKSIILNFNDSIFSQFQSKLAFDIPQPLLNPYLDVFANLTHWQYLEKLKLLSGDEIWKFAQLGHSSAIEMLIQEDFDLSDLMIDNKLPIQYCFEKGFFDLVFKLIDCVKGRAKDLSFELIEQFKEWAEETDNLQLIEKLVMTLLLGDNQLDVSIDYHIE